MLGTELTHLSECAAFAVMVAGKIQELPSSSEALLNYRLLTMPRYLCNEIRKLYSTCSQGDMTCIVESMTISGREMYLVRVFYSERPPTDLIGKRFHDVHHDQPHIMDVPKIADHLELNYDFQGRRLC